MKNIKSALPLMLFPLQCFAVDTSTAAKSAGANWIGLLILGLALFSMVGFFAYMILTEDKKQPPQKKED